MNHGTGGNTAMVVVGNQLVIADSRKTFICHLNDAGGLDGVQATVDNLASLFGRSVYALNGRVYLTGTSGKIYRLDLEVAPVITAQPQGQTVYPGANVFFSVTATATPPPTYQWQLNGTNLPGATTSLLLLNGVRARDGGDYTVVVSNSAGSVTSDKATLRIFGAPLIATQPRSQVGFWGKSVTFTVSASGTEPLGFQWFKDGSAIVGATSPTLILNDLRFEAQGSYTVVVSNTIDTITSAAAFLTVRPAHVTLGLYPGVTIDGIPGKTYQIQSVTDLTQTNQWLTLTNLTLARPVELWVDTAANAASPDQPKRFYQVVLLP